MKRVFLCVFLLINLHSTAQIDDSLNTLNLQNFPHFTEVIPEADDIEIENIKQKGKAKVLLFKTLYIQKHQGTWLYDSDSCSIKQIRATKMAYFSTGTQAIYCGLSFDVGVKERKFLRSTSYQILTDLEVGDTLRFTLTTLADRESKFQPHIYFSKKAKARRGKLKNGKYLTYYGLVPNASLNDTDLAVNIIEIPITEDNEGIKWIHIVNNEDEQDKGFIIENDYSLGGTIDEDLDRVYFAIDSYQLNNEAKALLDKIITSLTNSSKIVLRGYADPSGQKAHNLQLAKSRAIAVKDYLIKKGVDPSSIKIEEFDIGGHSLAKENRICTILAL